MNKMRTIAIFSIFMLVTFHGYAQKTKNAAKAKAYQFTAIKEIPTTSVKDQFKSGTCWSFATNSFLESELLRMGKPEIDFSEMFVVYNAYMDKAERYARLQGKCNLPGGGANADVINVWKKYGMMPESAFSGIQYDEAKHVHGEMDKGLFAYMESVVSNKKISNVWKNGFEGILKAYLGEIPETFVYEGVTYTPRSFADQFGVKTEDYVKFTSFTHYPYYEYFVMDVPDNWSGSLVMNVPLDELQKIADYAIQNGYSINWGGDVSEKGFSWKNGLAIIPDEETKDFSGTERDKWESLTEKEKVSELYKFETIVPEKAISQEFRQKEYDNYSTADDHGMHIVGISKDQKGNEYFKVKNSWSTDNPYQGYLYMSKPYFRGKTTDIMIHKDAIPAEILSKLKL